MDKNSLSHTTWNCKYHIVFAPKYRRQIIYGKIKAEIGKILRTLCDRKGVEIIGMEQATFDRKAIELDERFRKADARVNRLKAEKQDRLMRVCSVKKYVENLRGQAGPIDVWNEQAWCLLVMQVTIHADGSAEFLFRGENRITVK